MKLKFLIMPFAVLFSVIIIIWYAYPSWFSESSENSVVVLKKKIEEEKKEVSSIQIKKENITVLGQSLQERTDVKNIISGYYPQIRKEEHIMNKINHIATTTGVFLINMTVEYASASEDFSKILNIPKKASAVNALAQKKGSDDANIVSNKKQLGAVIVDVDARGEYGQLSAFLQSINLIGTLNSVRGFDIHRVDIENIDGEELSTQDMKKLGLSGQIAFGFSGKDTRDALTLINLPLFNSNKLNFDFILENKDILMAKYPDSSVNKTGTLNPFLP